MGWAIGCTRRNFRLARTATQSALPSPSPPPSRSRCVRPVFVAGDHVVIRWQFHFDWPDGSTTDIDELAFQRWEGDAIVEEKFYYDPAQLARKGAGGGSSAPAG